MKHILVLPMVPATLALLAPGVTLALLAAGAALAGDMPTIEQKERSFDHSTISIEAGQSIRFVNDDDFGHQVYADAPGFSFDTDETDPGGHVDVKFPKPGHYTVLCHIHPKMRMDVDVR